MKKASFRQPDGIYSWVSSGLNSTKNRGGVSLSLSEGFEISLNDANQIIQAAPLTRTEWLTGQTVVQSTVARAINLHKLQLALSEIVGSENLPKWIRQPNPALAGQTPIQLLEQGQSDRLWQLVHQIGRQRRQLTKFKSRSDNTLSLLQIALGIQYKILTLQCCNCVLEIVYMQC